MQMCLTIIHRGKYLTHVRLTVAVNQFFHEFLFLSF